MNPCPCGGGPPGQCRCDEAALRRYARRVSGPLLDRFDLRVNVVRPGVDDLLVGRDGEPTAEVATRVGAARRAAIARQGVLNGELRPARLDEVAALDPGAAALLRREIELDRLTGRGYHRIRRVARTIADLRGEVDGQVSESDAALALEMRASVGRPGGAVAA
jgi:magnesium chelatase family protein